MLRMLVIGLLLFEIVCMHPSFARAEGQRAATPMDCLQIRRLQHSPTFWSAIQFDPAGRYVAYGIARPSFEENQYRVELYVKRVDLRMDEPARLLVTADGINQLHWLSDGRHVMALMKKGSRSVIESIDILSSTHRTLVSAKEDIQEFSVDRAGKVIVFDTAEPQPASAKETDPEAVARGYRIAYEVPEAAAISKRVLSIVHRDQKGSWSSPQRIMIREPFEGSSLNSFPGVDNHGDLDLSLSPDGKKLIFSYRWSGKIPAQWEANPSVQRILHSDFPVSVNVLYDVEGKTTTLATQTYWTIGIPYWSADSRSFTTMSYAPIGSVWEQQDNQKKLSVFDSIHLFVVDAGTLQAQLVKVPKLPNPSLDEPMAWGNDGVLWLHIAKDTIAPASVQHGEWATGDPVHVPLAGEHGYSVVASNGRTVIGSYETPTLPPQLYAYDVGGKSLKMFTDLNPQFHGVRPANVEHVHWETSEHYGIDGMLIKPSDFVPGRRYPLVIQTKTGGSEFVCDAGPYNFPSSIPLPLAEAGIMFLYRTQGPDDQPIDDKPHFLKGYPGEIGEAALQTEIWDAAVDKLNQEGIVDSTKVGIVGFSRSGWYTEFALAHGKTHYRAANATDNVAYSLGEYWFWRRPAGVRAFDEMYGGSPWGKGFEAWRDYSISLNLQKIHTPLLMEEMGYGTPYLDNDTVPNGLVSIFEVFNGLNSLHRPVELYYYPNESHQMDHPKARLENLQRNLDWLRFWLQGYENPKSEDPNRYFRWRQMRDRISRGEPQN